MPPYQVIDPKGVHHGSKRLEKGDTVDLPVHSAQIRVWLRFRQIREASAEKQKPAPAKQEAGKDAKPPEDPPKENEPPVVDPPKDTTKQEPPPPGASRAG